MRTTFIKTITEFAKQDERIVVMTGDLGFRIFDELREAIGPRFINAGVAEANMMSVAAGMAMAGKVVYCYSIAPFATMRPFEQIRLDICSHNLPVRVVGIGAALGYAMEGVTHHALEDVSVLRAIPNMTVVAPGDKREVEALTKQSIDFPGPMYLRLAKDTNDLVHPSVPDLHIGEAITVHPGEDIVLLSSGGMLTATCEAREALLKHGIDVGIISMPTVKPLDLVTLRKVSKTASAIFTLEEHTVTGGFGSAVAENLLEIGFSGLFHRFGIPDQFFNVVGDQEHLRRAIGLDVDSIVAQIMKLLDSKSAQSGKRGTVVNL